MLTRRQFLIGSAAGLILPQWLLKAQHYLENEGEPLLEPPVKATDVLTAFGEGDRYTLHLNYDPDIQPSFTWREMIQRYDLTNGEPLQDWLPTLQSWGFKGNLNEKVDDWTAFEFWLDQEGPVVKAYELLERLQMGDFLGAELAGSLIFGYGFHPGDSTPHVMAEDDITLSLLQKKLNDLGMTVKVVRDYW